MFPDCKTMAQAFVLILTGREMGLNPMESITGLQMIKGKPTLTANTRAALIKRSGKYDYKVITKTDELCEIDFLEGGVIVGRESYSIEDAKKAGLASGDNYKKFPKACLFAGCIRSGSRTYCPDAMSGAIYDAEELREPARIDYQPQSIEGNLAVSAVSEAMDDGRFDLIAEIDGLARQKWGDKFRISLARFKEQHQITGGLPANMTEAECHKLIELLTPAAEGELI
jgi:hypothetical protein